MFILVRVYGPNDDQPEFFVNMFRKLEDFEGKRILIGDFNTGLNPDIDRTSLEVKNSNKSAEIIKTYMDETMLSDVWRDRNPDKRIFTRIVRKPKVIGGRIDYALCDTAISGWIKNIKIGASFKSDHDSILVHLNPSDVKRGRGVWRLNTQVLTEMDYINRINDSIERVQQNSSGQRKQEIWETMKLHIIGESQSYCSERAANRKLIISQLEEKLNEYNERTDMSETEINIFNRTKEDFEFFVDEKAQGAKFRSQAKWHTESERGTKYFLNLEKARSGSKSMNAIIKDDGSEETDPKQILKIQERFFTKLYTSDKNVEFKYKNKTNLTLMGDLKQSMEGEFKMHELQLAIRESARGKACGCDGIPLEFYVVFFEKLKWFLLDAINESLETGMLHSSAMRGIISLIPKKKTLI